MERNVTNLMWKWIGRHPVDLNAIRTAILLEKRAAERGDIRVSPGLLCEMRAELAYVSHLLNQGN